ncbi:hypothetical protein HRbin36_01747 [bacterium HR36]|nr:hypothetical protein HRbin36_01747 [bacterium HR36]
MAGATDMSAAVLEDSVRNHDRHTSAEDHQHLPEPEAWQNKLERLRRIWRGQEQYGEGSPVEQARRYYFQHMFAEVVRRASERSFADKPPPSVYLLISLLGYSPETTLLTFELLLPAHLLVITHLDAQRELNYLCERLIQAGKLEFFQYERQLCEASDHLSIFRIIEQRLQQSDVRQQFERTRQEGSEQPRRIPVMVDITGGKKVMGAVAALAAWEFNAVPCYLDGDRYDREMRRPEPGTEKLLILDQAMSEFGGQELQAAVKLSEAGAFEAAYQQFNRLADHLAHPERARLHRDISRLYSAWCNLDMQTLRECTDTLKAKVEAARLPLSHSDSRAVRAQLDFLEKLVSHDRDSLVLNHYLLGLHYQKMGRHDFAALLFYRTIEGCFARRLEKRSSEFNLRRPDYKLLGDPDELWQRYHQWAKKWIPISR